MVIRHSTGWDQITAIVGSDEAVAHQLSVKCQVDLSSAQKLPEDFSSRADNSALELQDRQALRSTHDERPPCRPVLNVATMMSLPIGSKAQIAEHLLT